MFGLRFRSRPRIVPASRQCRLGVERLEFRDCPASTGMSLNATVLSGHAVLLTGHINDESPSSTLVTFGGVMTGSVYPDAAGDFSFQSNASGLGTITAVATNGQTSLLASANIAVVTPTISGLSVHYGQGHMVTIAGQVNDQSPGGLTVAFAGAAVGTTVTQSDGSFSVTLAATSLGNVQAVATDAWGLASQAVVVVLANEPPVITSFTCAQVSGDTWIIRGTVVDESCAGLIVEFGGYVTASATVKADGSFSAPVDIPPGPGGIATADVTDWWGLAAEQAWTDVAGH